MEVVVYSKSNCPACVAVKRDLKNRCVEFIEVMVDVNTEKRHWLLAQGHRSVPQVYVDGIHMNPAAITGTEMR